MAYNPFNINSNNNSSGVVDASSYLGNGKYTIPNPLYKKGSKKEPKTIQTSNPFAVGAMQGLANPAANAAFNTNATTYIDHVPDLKDYTDNGVRYNHIDTDLRNQLADRQGIFGESWNALKQTVVSELFLGTAKAVSDVFGFVAHTFGGDEDYQNPASNYIEGLQNSFNQNNQIFVRDDANWYSSENIMSHIPSVAGILAMGLGSGLAVRGGKAALGYGISKAAKLGNIGERAAIVGDKVKNYIATVGAGAEAGSDGAKALNAVGKLMYRPGVADGLNAVGNLGLNAIVNTGMWNYSEAHNVYNQMYAQSIDKINNMSDEEYSNFVNRNSDAFQEENVDVNDRQAVAKAIAKKSADRTYAFDWTNVVASAAMMYGVKNVFKGLQSGVASGSLQKLQDNSIKYVGKSADEIAKIEANTAAWQKVLNWGYYKTFGSKQMLISQVSGAAQMGVVNIGRQEGINYGNVLLGEKPVSSFDNRMADYLANSELYEELAWGVAAGIGSHFVSAAIHGRFNKFETNRRKNKFIKEHGLDKSDATKMKEVDILFSGDTPIKRSMENSINARSRILSTYIQKVQDIKDGNSPIRDKDGNKVPLTTDREAELGKAENEFITNMVTDAVTNGTAKWTKAYIDSKEFRQMLIDKNILAEGDAEALQSKISGSIDKISKMYDDEYSKALNNVSQARLDRERVSRRTGRNLGSIPIQYAQIIAKQNLYARLDLEGIDALINALEPKVEAYLADAAIQDRIDVVNYKQQQADMAIITHLANLYREKNEINKIIENPTDETDLDSAYASLDDVNYRIEKTKKYAFKFDTAENAARSIFLHAVAKGYEGTDRGFKYDREATEAETNQLIKISDTVNTIDFGVVDKNIAKGDYSHLNAEEVYSAYMKNMMNYNKHMRGDKATINALIEAAKKKAEKPEKKESTETEKKDSDEPITLTDSDNKLLDFERDFNVLQELKIQKYETQNRIVATRGDYSKTIANLDITLNNIRSKEIELAITTLADINDKHFKAKDGVDLPKAISDMYNGELTMDSFVEKYGDKLNSAEIKNIQQALTLIGIQSDYNKTAITGVIRGLINNNRLTSIKESQDKAKAKVGSGIKEKKGENNPTSETSPNPFENKEPINQSQTNKESSSGQINDTQPNVSQTEPKQQPKPTEQKSPETNANTQHESGSKASDSIETNPIDIEEVEANMSKETIDEANGRLTTVTFTKSENGLSVKSSDSSDTTPARLIPVEGKTDTYEVVGNNESGISYKYLLGDYNLYDDRTPNGGGVVTKNPVIKIGENGKVEIVEKGVLEVDDGSKERTDAYYGESKVSENNSNIPPTGGLGVSHATESTNETNKTNNVPLTPEEKIAIEEARNAKSQNIGHSKEDIELLRQAKAEEERNNKFDVSAARSQVAKSARTAMAVRDGIFDVQAVINKVKNSNNITDSEFDIEIEALVNTFAKHLKARGVKVIDGNSEIKAGEINQERKNDITNIIEGAANEIFRSKIDDSALTNAQTKFIESVNNLVQDFIRDTDGVKVGDKTYFKTSDLLNYINKQSGDSTLSDFIYDTMIAYFKTESATKRYGITDKNVQDVDIKSKAKQSVDEKIETIRKDATVTQNDLSPARIFKELTESGDAQKQAEYREFISSLKVGDEVKLEVDYNGRGVVTANGKPIDRIIIPQPDSEGYRTITTKGITTDVLIDAKGNIHSRLYKALNKILDAQFDDKDSDAKSFADKLIRYRFDKENRSAIAAELADTETYRELCERGIVNENTNYKQAIDYLSNIWNYIKDNTAIDIKDRQRLQKESIDAWFRKLDATYNIRQAIADNPNKYKITIENISDGSLNLATTDGDTSKMLTPDKAIGNRNTIARMAYAPALNVFAISGHGLVKAEGMNKYSTVVAIQTPSGKWQYAHVYPNAVNAESLGKDVNDIITAIRENTANALVKTMSETNQGINGRKLSITKALNQLINPANKHNLFNGKRGDGPIAFAPHDRGVNISWNNKTTRAFVFTNRKYPVVIIYEGNNRRELVVKDADSAKRAADAIIDKVVENSNFNILHDGIRIDNGGTYNRSENKASELYGENWYDTDNGGFNIKIGDKTWHYDSYNDFLMKNNMVLINTKPVNGSNFSGYSGNFEGTKINIAVRERESAKVDKDGHSGQERTKMDTNPPVEGSEDAIRSNIVSKLNDKANSRRNKGALIASEVLGEDKVKDAKKLALFPKKVIFVEDVKDNDPLVAELNSTTNAIANPSDKPVKVKGSNIEIPAKTVIIGNKMISDLANPAKRWQVPNKLMHEQLHIRLHSNGNEKYIPQIKEIYDELTSIVNDDKRLEAAAARSKELGIDVDADTIKAIINKYSFAEKEYRNSDGSINEKGLEEFLVETLTSRELSHVMNSIDRLDASNKTKGKQSIMQRIMKLISKILDWDIRNGSLREKELESLRDAIDSKKPKEEKIDKQNETENVTPEDIANKETNTSSESKEYIEKTLNDDNKQKEETTTPQSDSEKTILNEESSVESPTVTESKSTIETKDYGFNELDSFEDFNTDFDDDVAYSRIDDNAISTTEKKSAITSLQGLSADARVGYKRMIDDGVISMVCG